MLVPPPPGLLRNAIFFKKRYYKCKRYVKRLFEYKHLPTRCYKLKQLKRNLLLLSVFCFKKKGLLVVSIFFL